MKRANAQVNSEFMTEQPDSDGFLACKRAIGSAGARPPTTNTSIDSSGRLLGHHLRILIAQCTVAAPFTGCISRTRKSSLPFMTG